MQPKINPTGFVSEGVSHYALNRAQLYVDVMYGGSLLLRDAPCLRSERGEPEEEKTSKLEEVNCKLLENSKHRERDSTDGIIIIVVVRVRRFLGCCGKRTSEQRENSVWCFTGVV